MAFALLTNTMTYEKLAKEFYRKLRIRMAIKTLRAKEEKTKTTFPDRPGLMTCYNGAMFIQRIETRAITSNLN
jgi:hypothetical protein